MLRDFGDRENSRVRDLVDLAILLEHDLLVPEQTAAAVRSVWLERNNTEPPYVAAVANVTQLWLTMFPRCE